MNKLLSAIALILLFPFLIIIGILIKIDSPGPIIFKQKRLGKNQKPFTIYKFRTMIKNAELMQSKYQHLNQSDGPLFKIPHDPRTTKIGFFLRKYNIDELPQFFNVLKGEMDLVGPRPFPVQEAKKIPKKYQQRFSINPGLTSPWAIKGMRHNNFNSWMKSDLNYIKNKSIWKDIKIIAKTIKIMLHIEKYEK